MKITEQTTKDGWKTGDLVFINYPFSYYHKMRGMLLRELPESYWEIQLLKTNEKVTAQDNVLLPDQQKTFEFRD